MIKAYLFVLLTIFLLTGCSKDDNTPSWLVIDEIQLETNEITEGVNSHNILDAWVYMDGQPLGVHNLPAEIPILAEGEHDFTIYAGIQINGINATRTTYPFYTRFDKSITLVKDEKTKITPVVNYKPEAQFQLLEDFEDVGVDFISDPISDTSIVTIDNSSHPEIVKYGNKCGAIYLSEVDSIFKAFTSSNLNLPQGGDVYMELDYMNTNTMLMGLIPENAGGSQEQPPIAGISQQDPDNMRWKKIYFDLEENVSFETNATSFELYLVSVLDSNNTSAVIYLDNIKVIRFE